MTGRETGPGLLDSGLEALGVTPGQRVTGLLNTYADELEKWSRSYNLVSVKNREELIVRHLLDSISVQRWIGPSPLLDVGSGAGLPGIPLAIIRPETEVTLLDGNGKKVRFCQHVRRTLGLENVFPVQSRLEAFEPGLKFDQVITRAFSSLVDFAAAARRLLAPGGRMLAMKGHWPHDEIAELPDDVHVDSVEPLNVPHLHAERHLVMMSVTAPSASPRSTS